jgi:uncharacterized protein (TIGR01777 family)
MAKHDIIFISHQDKPMNEKTKHTVAMSGASGFVGTNLQKAFRNCGWNVLPLGRGDFKASTKELAARISGADIVINLAGAPVINRWTAEYKKTMYDSRINVTGSLVNACSIMETKPNLFISASAVGYYASGGVHTEDNHVRADDFLGHLTRDWEKEALKAEEIGIRTIVFRFGIVLGKDGGALKQMITPFKMGMGGTIGDGSQPFSWIHIGDLVRAYETAIQDNSFNGIYNLTAPNPTTNKGLTEAMGKALGKPALMRIPKFVLKLQFGEGAQVLAGGPKVIPERLMQEGFTFQHTEINEAVKDCVT